jgi:hypothetical protein
MPCPRKAVRSGGGRQGMEEEEDCNCKESISPHKRQASKQSLRDERGQNELSLVERTGRYYCSEETEQSNNYEVG